MKKVVIIGGGLSGLTTGYLLSKRNYDVTILESKDRLGGRVFTQKEIGFDNTSYFEVGAEWIGKTHKHILKICSDFGLSLNDHSYTKNQYFLDNKYSVSDSDRFEAVNKKIMELITNISSAELETLDGISWEKFLLQHFSAVDIKARELIDSSDFLEHPRNLSAGYVIEILLKGGENDHMDWQLAGGNCTLIESLAAAVGKNNIHCSSPVLAICKSGKQMEVTAVTGKYFADLIVCTVPISVTKRINWDGVLPADFFRDRSILKYGQVTKTAFVLPKHIPAFEGLSVVSDLMSHGVYHCTDGQKNATSILMSYSAGFRSEQMSRANNDEKWENLLKTLAQKKLVQPTKIISINWQNDLDIAGGYSLFAPEQRNYLPDLLRKSFDNVFFAGEHTATFSGFMEGAVESAHRVVSEICD